MRWIRTLARFPRFAIHISVVLVGRSLGFLDYFSLYPTLEASHTGIDRV